MISNKNNYKDEKCLVCKAKNLEPFLYSYSSYNPKLFHRIAICRDCGHIQQYPLFKKGEYLKINDNFFGRKYMQGENENIYNNTKKLEKIDKILSSYLRDGLNILDVGPGEGWAMKYFLKLKCKYSAIEHSDRLSSLIQKKGGNVIGKDLYDDYSKYKSKFDVIIFRHVLEHLLNPMEGLVALKKLLSSDGLIYVNLPNAENPNQFGKGFKTSYIRPVHISYFCIENVLRLANSVGLDSIYSESDGQIYCLLKHSPVKHISRNLYDRQKEIYIKKSKEALIKDSFKIIKALPRDFFRKIFST